MSRVIVCVVLLAAALLALATVKRRSTVTSRPVRVVEAKRGPRSGMVGGASQTVLNGEDAVDERIGRLELQLGLSRGGGAHDLGAASHASPPPPPSPGFPAGVSDPTCASSSSSGSNSSICCISGSTSLLVRVLVLALVLVVVGSTLTLAPSPLVSQDVTRGYTRTIWARARRCASTRLATRTE